MKKSYYYMAVAVAAVTALTAVASADQAPYRRQSPRYAQDDQQPLPLPPEDQQQGPQDPCQGRCPQPRCRVPGCEEIGVLPGGVNIVGNGNTIIIQMGDNGQAYRAVIPSGACYNHYSCQAVIPQLTWQPILAPQWGCGNGYACGNVPTYYTGVPYFAQYAAPGANYFVYSPVGRGVVGRPYGFYQQYQPYQPGLRHPARRYR